MRIGSLITLAALAAGFATPAVFAAQDASISAEVQAKLPDTSVRDVNQKAKSKFQAFYAYSGAQKWSNWTSANSQKDAQSDAEALLKNGGKYTHAFIVRKSDNKIVWQSWK